MPDRKRGLSSIARGRSLGRREPAERLQLLRHRAFFAEPADAHLVERGELGARRDLVEGRLDQGG